MGVIGALISLSAALARLLPDTDPITRGWRPAATFVFLAVMFGLAEVYVLHVQVKREAQTVALSEIPLVLGLTFAAPTLLVGALVLGASHRLPGAPPAAGHQARLQHRSQDRRRTW